MKVTLSLLVIAFCGLASCEEMPPGPEKASWDEVKSAWTGGAELNRYQLEQQRYGEIRKGQAMLVFVREPFLKDRQVKDESGRGNYEVLKMNSIRDFLTGVYPYHTMVSVFQPLEEGTAGKALKVTSSVQEWCGHTFTQSNRRKGVISTEVKSYFEKEDAQIFEEKRAVYLEDEIWTALRLDPLGLPVGEVKMVPGALFSCLSHHEPVAEEAQTRWVAGKDGKTVIYEITYPQSGRVLAIEIQKKLPYTIQSWKESKGQTLLSSGQLKEQLSNIDYWNYTSENKGKKLRSKLGF